MRDAEIVIRQRLRNMVQRVPAQPIGRQKLRENRVAGDGRLSKSCSRYVISARCYGTDGR